MKPHKHPCPACGGRGHIKDYTRIHCVKCGHGWRIADPVPAPKVSKGSGVIAGRIEIRGHNWLRVE